MPRYGEIWTVGHPADPEILPRVPHLVISGDLYNDAGLGAIVVEIDPNQLRAPELHQPIPGLGTAMLDRLAWYPQNWLREHVGELPDERHDEITRLVRNLIGNA
ncbi:MAG: type II toxin-antitoxin system PemK/MazF family toxin [Nocardioidaceae bacterium]|nr:type II toxin-antitoxin system PemK/MazF family toxin [Pseudonocardiales bacterium]